MLGKMLTLIINKVLFCTEPVYGGSNAPAIFFLLPMMYRKFFVDKNISGLVFSFDGGIVKPGFVINKQDDFLWIIPENK